MELAGKLLGLIALALAGISLLFNIISLAISTWIYLSKDGYSSSMGLWSVCVTTPLESSCQTLQIVPSYIEATRAMMILGMLLNLAAVVVGSLKLFLMTNQIRFPKLAGASAVVAGAFMLVGAIIYGAKFAEGAGASLFKLHAGFGLAIVAGLVAITAGIGFLVAENKKQI